MLDQRCDELVQAAAASDADGFQAGIVRLWEAAEGADPAELDRVLVRVCNLFEAVPLGIAARLAVMAGALVEDGADPRPLVKWVALGLGASLDSAVEFVTVWRRVAGDRLDMPQPEDSQAAFDAALAALKGRGGWRRALRVSAGLPDKKAYLLVEGWFASAQWALPAATLLQNRDVRIGFPLRERLAAAVATVAPLRPDLECLVRLLAVLDDERLVVLHRPTGRGYEVTIGGVGDNFQLHTLLAAALSGPDADGLLEGVRLDPSWLAAASDGPLEPVKLIRGQFNLVDGYGEWIWNEGKPADIPLLDGRRVLVLDRPPYERTWNLGRTFPMLRADVRLERTMQAEEAAGWLSRVAPAAPEPSSTPAEIRMVRRPGEAG